MGNRARSGGHGPAWQPDFAPPEPPRTDRVWLEVLGPDVAALDLEAILGSRVRLRDELRWGGWPPDGFTLADNVADLAEHLAEHEAREAYAWTVLAPERSRCLGCVYLEPWADGARLALWVIDAELDTGLEAHLLEILASWLGSWPLGPVRWAVRPHVTRSRRLAAELGLPEVPGPPDHVSFRITPGL